MYKKFLRLVQSSILFVVLLLFSACSSVQPTTDPNLAWSVRLQKVEVKERLEGITTVTQYNGTKYDEFHQQEPAEGKVYLLLKLSIHKQVSGSSGFKWNELFLQASDGDRYTRLSDDSFLELYQYTPRMPGVELKLGETEGWICFEISQQAADGQLVLLYEAEGSQQELVVQR